MILHLLDDEKITNCIISNFREAIPNRNRFLCFHTGADLKFVMNDVDILFVKYDEYEIDKCVFDGVDKILIHYLHPSKVNFLYRNIPLYTNIKIYWVLWGGDIYNKVLFTKGYKVYYEPRFLDYYGPKFRFKEFIKSFLKPETTMKFQNNSISEFIASKIDGILTTEPEFQIIKKYIGCNIRASFIDKIQIYYPIEDVLGSLYGKRVEGDGIMIGNSGSFTNNHVYAMNILSKLNTGRRQKNVPLSYGGNAEYIDHVKKRGHKLWGENFKPIDGFMPLDQYNRLMLSNNVFIYGNWRQEAMGNIVIALYLGAKVFVSEKSPLLEYFRSKGIKIYSCETMTQSDIDSPEDNNNIENNRKIILQLNSKEAIINNIKDIFS